MELEECGPNSSWSLKNFLTSNKQRGPNENTAASADAAREQQQQTSPSNTTLTKDGVSNIDRYAHDMKLAEQMRRGMQKRKTNANKSLIDESDVSLGLNGLEQADVLQEAGQLSQALSISEKAIELLIEFLKSDPSLLPHISRGTVSARVQAALTNAEEMKRRLAATGRSAASSPKGKKSTSPERCSSTIQSTEALSGALSRAVKKATNRTAQCAGQSTSSAQGGSGPQDVAAIPVGTSVPNRQRVSKPSNKKAGTGKNKASKFYHSQDPMVQTIKSELYVSPSELQNISWDDIAGLKTAKQALQENAILPLVRPDLFTGLRKPRNILLYGPPGTGKTMLVKAVAKESECLLFICTASTLTSKWHGEGEKLLKTLFQVARAAAPSIIFVDEMDALLSARRSEGEHEASRRFKTEFMSQVDGIVKNGGTSENGKHLLVISCTNCPWDIDSAVLRRFPRRIYIPLPDTSARNAMLSALLEKAGKHNISSTELKAVAKRLRGFSGSDIASIASEASFGPIRSLGTVDAIKGINAVDLRPISVSDFDDAIKQSTKSVSKDLLKRYDEWKQEQAA